MQIVSRPFDVFPYVSPEFERSSLIVPFECLERQYYLLLAGIENWFFKTTPFCSHITPEVGRTRYVFRRLYDKISVLVQTLLTRMCFP
jgi:hypothetical protein